MIERMAADIPEEYLEGIAAIDVSPKTIPHPTRGDVYTLGECIPIDVGPDHVTSRVVLYHGSFQALSEEQLDFDWREEAWETLLHELRHHVEWRARSPKLEEYDWAVEQNFARHEGHAHDPVFYRAGECIDNGIFRVEDDIFIERIVSRAPEEAEFVWHGKRYAVTVPSVDLPLYLVLDGIEPPPAGEAILVFRRRPGLRDLFRSVRPIDRSARAQPID